MKKIAVVLALVVFSLAMFVPFNLNNQSVQAQTGGYSIQTVTHSVRVLYSGQVVISDTIQITGTMPSSIQVGFPFQYGSYVLEVEAYDSNNNVLPVTADVPLQDRSGFYGTTIDLSDATGSTFTVIFVLSNGLVTPTSTGFSLNYPAYPSLTTPVATVNANLTLPIGAAIREIAKDDGVVNVTSYTKSNLAAFTSTPANATFTAVSDNLQKVNIPTLDRSINVNPSGVVTSTDKYTILNNGATSLSFFKLDIPLTATNIAARDQFGRNLAISTQDTFNVARVVNITFVQAVGTESSIEISVDYSLPSITPEQSGLFVLDMDLYAYFDYYVESLSATITPPEGATLVSPSPSQIVSRNAFQETLTVNKAGITYTDTIFDQEALQVTFNYNPLWIAFRPTIWMWVIAAVGAAIVAFMLRPKAKVASAKISAPIAAAIGVSADQIRTFVDGYEEKMRIKAEIKSLEARVNRGRIPRRRYKVQRTSLETRLATLDKTTDELKEVLRSSGGSHADTVRQLEAAEVNFNEADLSLTTLETRHNVGEVSLEEYKDQLTELERRKEKAANTINGLLLRLRGEIS